jgi:F0F1-type ATP synthase membrane subunit a
MQAAPLPVSDAKDSTGALLALGIIALLTALRVALLVASPLDLFVDEAQYWLWSTQPAAGYFSKPPLIAWVIRAVTDLAGSDAPFWVRMPGAVLHAVTAVLAVMVFLGVTILGFVKNGAHFLGLFWVSSAPLALRPVLAVIEIISYFVRPVSHSIRLAGNVMAGHAVIKVFAGFAALAAIAPVSILAITAMYGLEVLVALIQAYVFTILTCVYLKDALHPGH